MAYFTLALTLLITSIGLHIVQSVLSDQCDVYDGNWGKRLTLGPRLNCQKFIRNGVLHLRGAGVCDSEKFQVPLNYSDNVLNYEWIPKSCPRLIEYSSNFIAQYLSSEKKGIERGKKIYFVGDSIMIQMYQTLVCRLYDQINLDQTYKAERDLVFNSKYILPMENPLFNKSLINLSQTRGGIVKLKQGGEVEMLVSDYLVNSTHELFFVPEKSFAKQNRFQAAWAKRILEDSKIGDIIVFNTGAHYEYNHFEAYKNAITISLIFLKKSFKGSYIFYRDSFPGVEPCKHQFIKPSEKVKNPPLLDLYNYKLIPMMNKYVREVAKEINLKIHFIRVYKLTTMRCDRRDFLHFCIPGPQYEWVRLMLHNLFTAKN